MKFTTDTHGHTQNLDVIDSLPQSFFEEVKLSESVCVEPAAAKPFAKRGLWPIKE